MHTSRAPMLLALSLSTAGLAGQEPKATLRPEMMRVAAGYAAKVTASAIFRALRTAGWNFRPPRSWKDYGCMWRDCYRGERVRS